MTILAPGRPQTASSDAPMGTPSTPPVQNLRCPQANSILTVCQGVSPTLKPEKMTAVPASSTANSSTLPMKVPTW